MIQNKKTALISGGSRGIGRAIAIKLAQSGYDIAITYHQATEEADKTLSELTKAGANAFKIKADFSKQGEVANAFKQFSKVFNCLDVLINNAGWTQYIEHKKLDDLTEDIFDKIISIHFKSVFQCCSEAIKLMKNDSGTIINITSIAAYNAVGSNIAYCAAKAATNNMTKSLSRALGPKIRVNGIAPGLTETDMTLSAPAAYRKEQTEITALNRLATPEDIADTALSLIETMTFVNGKTIIVDGGRIY